MILRRWSTGLELGGVDAYERFARGQSLPMFMAQPGCLGAMMANDGSRADVVTLWDSPDAVEALETSARYRRTVEALTATGVLRGSQALQSGWVHTIHLAEPLHKYTA